MRALLVGWFSFLHGEATAGDVAALDAVQAHLSRLGVPHDAAWSPVFSPEGLSLDDADPDRYTHVVFVCGPLHGQQIVQLHQRFRRCLRIAVGVSVIDPESAAVRGFHHVLARDGEGQHPRPDLAVSARRPSRRIPTVAIILAGEQGEYGDRSNHAQVAHRVTSWIAEQDCAPTPMSTRLDREDWRHCATPDQFSALIRRADLVVTTRLHGLVFALREGVPVIAIDPVRGGAKVAAQAQVLRWPAVVAFTREPPPGAGPEIEPALSRYWRWCLSPEGRGAADRCRHAWRHTNRDTDLLSELTTAMAE